MWLLFRGRRGRKFDQWEMDDEPVYDRDTPDPFNNRDGHEMHYKAVFSLRRRHALRMESLDG